MKLYWCPQSRAITALWMMEETGIPYERELIDIRAGSQSTPEYAAINPMMKVPALEDGPVKVAETGAVLAYVAERVPEAQLAPPVGDPKRGDYLRWLFFGPMIEAAFTQKVTGLDLASSTAGWGSYDRVIDVLEAGVKDGPWLLGERFSAADVMIGSSLHFGMMFKLIEPRPAFAGYVERCAARPAFQRSQAMGNA
jgi:glutathione S-transferase